MLENVKSSYFPKTLFSFMNEKTKLKIVKYNKAMQNNLNINLANYKIFSGKNIVYDNGKIKEYDSYDYELLFEGEYLNKKRNGKGKEYNSYGDLEFEGEYLNGKRNGKGKEFYDSEILKFEGEYLDGKRWNGKGYDMDNNVVYELKNGNGFIKEYNPDTGDIIFEGEYSNGIRNGKGKEYYRGELIYEGEYLNGERNGKGKEFYIDGKIKFEGEYLYGNKFKGKGYDPKTNILYELKNGKGFIKEYYYDHVLIYEGEYKDGKKMEKVNNIILKEN